MPELQKLRSLLLLGAAAAALQAAPAWAQAQEEIVVTGSRVKRQDLISSSPVTTVDQKEFLTTGTKSVEEYLNTLPQLIAGATKSTNVTGASDGTASLNLRGLGAKRTLVMVNGRRFMSSSQDGVVDVNNIPSALIDRVEVVTGGASAVYGSDAMAGVVNFILKDKFDGMAVDGQWGMSDRADGRTWSTSATVGGSTDKSHGWLHFTYEDRKDIRGKNREFSQYQLIDSNGTFTRTGSTGRLGGTMVGIPTPNGAGGYTSVNYALDNLTPRPFTSNDFNYAAIGDYLIQTPLKRKNLYGRGVYDLTDNVRFFVEASYNGTNSGAGLSRTAPNIQQTFNAPGMPANASFITPAMRAVLNARPDPNAPFNLRFLTPPEVGQRAIDIDRDMFRIIGGVEGKLFDRWSWDASYSYSHLNTNQVFRADVSRRAVVEASTPDPRDPTKCASGNPRCVLITNFDHWSPQLVNFLQTDDVSMIKLEEKVAAAHITGDAFQLPAGAVGVAFGAEYRTVESSDTPAPILQDFISAGYAERAATRGKFDVSELYGEAVVPLLSKMKFADYVGLELAARYSDYSSSGSVWTYKAGGEWRFDKNVRFRGLFQRAVRAPNILEMYGGEAQTFPNLVDPCSASSRPTGATAALCQAQGIPASMIGVYQQVGTQVEARTTANPNLQPEKSNTITLGFVVTPEVLPGLNVTVDYYDIKIDNAIDRLGGGPAGVLAGCFASGDATSTFCRSFQRSGTSYEINNFRVPLANVASLHTAGIDMAARYSFDVDSIGIGKDIANIGVNVMATWVQKNTFKASNSAAAVDRVGTVGGDTPAIPEWRAATQLSYRSSGLELIWRTQFLSGVKDRKYAAALAAGSATPKAGIANPEVPDYWYHNIHASYAITDSYSVYGGIRNLFDKQPPLLSSPIESNTDPNTYDAIGRFFYLGASVRF
jgi:iron complex outermembrane recepter protein